MEKRRGEVKTEVSMGKNTKYRYICFVFKYASLHLYFSSIIAFLEKFGKLIVQSYYAAVSYIDNMIGKLIHQLHTSMVRENTIVILTSDHGTFD